MNHDSTRLISGNNPQLDQLLESQHRAEFARLKDQAEKISKASIALIAVALLAVLIAFAFSNHRTIRSFMLLASGGSFAMSLVSVVVAQLLHIRAALEKLSLD